MCDFYDMAERARQYHPEPAGTAAQPVGAVALGAPARRRVGTAHHLAPLPAVRLLDMRQATREGTRPLPAHDLVYRYEAVRARQPMTQDELEQRQARGVAALEHLRMVWKARELMRADFARRTADASWSIYGPPAREAEVVQIKRKRA